MGDKGVKSIEKAIEKLLEQQQALREEVSRLAAKIDARTDALRQPLGADDLLRFLDEFRAGEALGEASVAVWVAACRTESLRGALRAIQLREGAHARLLEERIKELGGAPHFEIPEDLESRLMEEYADPERSDAKKLRDFVKRFPDVDRALAPIESCAARLDHDPETRFLLRAIAEDERATLEFLHEAHAALED